MTTDTSITAAEYAAACRAAHTEAQQEMAAAGAEYRDAVRPLAARRKDRGRAARRKRDARIRELRAALHREDT